MSLLSVRAAAAQLGVGYSTLKHWIYDGTVRTTTTAGGHHRIADSEIARLLAKAGRAAPSRSGARAMPGEPPGLIVALSGRNPREVPGTSWGVATNRKRELEEAIRAFEVEWGFKPSESQLAQFIQARGGMGAIQCRW